MSVEGYAEHKFNDSRLGWSSEEWDGIDRLRLLTSQLWLPDVWPYNNIGVVRRIYSEY